MKVSHIGFILGLIGLTAAAPTFANTVSLCDGTTGNLIQNCGFESDSFVDWNTTAASSGSDFNVSTVLPDSGSYDARFGATNGLADFIDQSFTTVAGDTYTVSFYVDTTANGGVYNGQFQADWNGSQILLITNPQAGKGSETDLVNGSPVTPTVDSAGYEVYTLTEMATGTSTDLKFGGFAGTSYYHLDDVAVTLNSDPPSPTPEPSSVSFVLTGLIGIGLAARGYQQKRTNS
jgi:hypothetical protein